MAHEMTYFWDILDVPRTMDLYLFSRGGWYVFTDYDISFFRINGAFVLVQKSIFCTCILHHSICMYHVR